MNDTTWLDAPLGDVWALTDHSGNTRPHIRSTDGWRSFGRRNRIFTADQFIDGTHLWSEPKPPIVLPDSTGTVVRIHGDGDRHWLAWLSAFGDWDVITPRGEVERVGNPLAGIIGTVESVEILEPRAVTAKAVLERLKFHALHSGISRDDPHRTIFDGDWETVAAEFGVDAL